MSTPVHVYATDCDHVTAHSFDEARKFLMDQCGYEADQLEGDDLRQLAEDEALKIGFETEEDAAQAVACAEAHGGKIDRPDDHPRNWAVYVTLTAAQWAELNGPNVPICSTEY